MIEGPDIQEFIRNTGPSSHQKCNWFVAEPISTVKLYGVDYDLISLTDLDALLPMEIFMMYTPLFN